MKPINLPEALNLLISIKSDKLIQRAEYFLDQKRIGHLPPNKKQHWQEFYRDCAQLKENIGKIPYIESKREFVRLGTLLKIYMCGDQENSQGRDYFNQWTTKKD